MRSYFYVWLPCLTSLKNVPTRRRRRTITNQKPLACFAKRLTNEFSFLIMRHQIATIVLSTNLPKFAYIFFTLSVFGVSLSVVDGRSDSCHVRYVVDVRSVSEASPQIVLLGPAIPSPIHTSSTSHCGNRHATDALIISKTLKHKLQTLSGIH